MEENHTNIEMHEVESRQIHAIGHDELTHTLAIRFKNWSGEPSTLYHYENVDEDLFKELLSAESIGRYFNQNIKPETEKYPYRKIVENEEPVVQ